MLRRSEAVFERRVLAVLVLTVVPLLLLAGWAVWEQARQAEARVLNELVSDARAAALVAAEIVEGTRSTVLAVAHTPILADPAQHEAVPAFFRAVVAEQPEWEGIGLHGPDGWNLAATVTPPGTVSIADRPYFQQVQATGRPVVSSAVVGRVAGVPVVIFAAPVEFRTGERGVLIAPLNSQRLGQALGAFQTDRGVRVSVVDSQGQLFVHPDPAVAVQLVDARGRPEVDAALAGNTGVYRRGDLVIASAPVRGAGWAVLLEEPAADVLRAPRRQLATGVAGLGLTVAMVAVVALALGRHLADSYRRETAARERAEALQRTAEAARLAAQTADQWSRVLAARAAALSDASRTFAEARLDWEAVLDSVLRRTVSLVGDGGMITLVTGDDQQLEVVASFHPDEERLGILRAALTEAPPRIGQGITGAAVARGEPVVVSAAPNEAAVPLERPEHHALSQRLGFQSIAAAPLIVEGRPLGALTLWRDVTPEAYTEDDVTFLQELAHRAALAIDNARLHRQTEAALRIRDEFVSSVSHDLNNPLAAIKGNIQLMRRRLTRGHPLESGWLLESVDAIGATIERASQMVSELSDLARIRSGEPLDLAKRQADLVALAEHVVGIYQRTTGTHTIRLERRVETLVGVWDEGRLERVLSNLLSNAIKYSPAGGEIVVTVQRDGGDETPAAAERQGGHDGGAAGDRAGGDGAESGWAVLSVRDAGVGIPAEDLPHVFDRFYRGRQRESGIGGSGIGLTSVQQIVERHGGSVEVESVVGAGTTVTVRLPLTADLEAPAERDLRDAVESTSTPERDDGSNDE